MPQVKMLACKGIFTLCANAAGARQGAQGEAQGLRQQDVLRLLYRVLMCLRIGGGYYLRNGCNLCCQKRMQKSLARSFGHTGDRQ